MIYSLGSGRFTSGQPDAFYAPRIFQRAKPLVVYMPGNGFTPVNGPMSAKPLLDRLVAEGYAVVQPNVDGTLGNATAMSRMTDAITYGRANLPCKTAAPVACIGASNGGIASMQYLRQHPSDVAAVVTLITPPDLNYSRDNNLAGLRALLDAAWGVTWSSPGVQALPAHADLLSDAAAYVGIGARVQQWIATNDVLDNPATGHTMAEFAAAIGADAHSLGAAGHTETAWSSLDIPTALAWLNTLTA